MSDAPAPARGWRGLIARWLARAPHLSKSDAELLARIKFPCS
jgi:hypothetical protein